MPARSPKSPRFKLTDFRRVIVLFNPASTRAAQSLKRIVELERLYPQRLEIMTTTTGGRTANIALLADLKKQLGKDVLLCVAAGDGTVNIAVEALAANGLKAPMLPLWGGNANDLAYMLNGWSFSKSLRSLFRWSSVVPVYPLECTITHNGKTESRLAACYISFGMSGYSAHRMNDPKHRDIIRRKHSILRFPYELAFVGRSLLRAPSFRVQEDSTTHHVFEMVFANGSRIAKVDRLPVRLLEPAFYRDTLEHKKLGKLFRKFIGVLRGGLKQSRVQHPVHLTFKDTVWAQFDGEPVRIKAGSRVTVQLHDTPFYAVASSAGISGRQAKRNRLMRLIERHRFGVSVVGAILGLFLAAQAYVYVLNPYGGHSIVRQPYTTQVAADGSIKLHKEFDLHVHDNLLADGAGYYYISASRIAQNTLFGGQGVPGKTPQEISEAIAGRRFDPSKPYIISGDQFSVLYIRNLGVFYNQLMNPDIAHSQQDWQNRQRLYLQSAMYALDTLAKSKTIKTTVVPISPDGVAFTQVHPGATGSDTVYGLFYALQTLATPQSSVDGTRHRQTTAAAREVIAERRDDLKNIYQRYKANVADGDLIRKDIALSGARDGVHRQQSFYDTLVWWKTRQLAVQLGVSNESPEAIAQARQHILDQYWSKQIGCFRDELAKPQSYSSDWLLALPTGFVDPKQDADLLASCVDYIRSAHLADPIPIAYTRQEVSAPWAVRIFAGEYGGRLVWSYWGAEYMTLLEQLAATTGDQSYTAEADKATAQWDAVMVKSHGYPETLTPNGAVYRRPLYKSIITTGWVVQYDYARWLHTSQQR